MLSRIALVFGLAVLAAVRAGAADNPVALECSFASGVTHVYDKGRFVEEKAEALSFGIVAINTQAQSAELLMPGGGTSVLKTALAVNAIHFLEVAAEGALNITTVYENDDAKGSHPAVHSRHFALLGQPIVSQYQGFCRAKG